MSDIVMADPNPNRSTPARSLVTVAFKMASKCPTETLK